MVEERQRRLNNLEKDIDSIFTRAAVHVGLSDSARSTSCTALEAYGDGCSQKDLCERCWMGKQTINSPIKRLCEQGILEKTAGPGRTTTISLTATGRALVAEKVRPVIEAETAAMHAFSPAELAQALDLLERYRNALANALAEKGMV